MAILSNLNTQQTPMASVGLSGSQIVRLIPGARVYLKAADAVAAPVTVKSAGVKPTGWTDLGIVDGNAKVTYTKETKEVRTGIDNILRYVYTDKKTGNFQFTLSQVDDVVIQQLTGISPSALGGSVQQFTIGGEDVVTAALLLVLQNKLDGKELQFYHPGAFVTFSFQDNAEQMSVQGQGDLPLFAYGSNTGIYTLTIFP